MSFTATALAQSPVVPDEPVTLAERVNWVAQYTAGPAMLVGVTAMAGYSTIDDNPKQYGSHWQGFGKRYGLAMASLATGNIMEAGLGAIWGEDPRYLRAGEHADAASRLGHIVKWTFVAPDRNGDLRPAFARFAALAGSSFLANTWIDRDDANTTQALERTGLGILTRMAGNAFSEFWPDVKRKVFRLH